MNTPVKTISPETNQEKKISGIDEIKSDVVNILDNKFEEVLTMKVENLDELVIFNNLVNTVITKLMIEQYSLSKKPEKFIDAFRTSSISKFTWEETEKDELMDLIEKKKIIYNELLIESIKRGNFNFPKEDLADLVNLIGSGIFEWKDKLYRNYRKIIKVNGEMDFWEELYYWVPENKKPWSYKESLENSWINPDVIMELNNALLGNYLIDMVSLWINWNNNYKDWIEAEKWEVTSWLWDDNLVFIAPMENYAHKNFVDPEFLVLLREKTNTRPAIFENLSQNYYGDDYTMWKVNVFFAEPILKWWNASFWKFLWKSFPNDMELRENFGNFIIIVKWQFYNTFDEYYKMVAKVFNIDANVLLSQKSEIVTWATEETTYHEYGHSLFWVKNTLLEEMKASLFYWLSLYDKYVLLNEEINTFEIKRIMRTFTLDFTRYISRLKEPKSRKYVYTSQALLHHMIENNLIILDSENNCLNLNINNSRETMDNFKNLLINLFKLLNSIKNIYDTSDKNEEKKMTDFYDKNTLAIIEKLYENI